MKDGLLLLCLAATLGTALLTASGAEPGKRRGLVDITKLPPAASKTNVTYAADIKPIFDKSCVRCHAPGKAKANLRLDTLENALRGGENGRVILPGSSTRSVLVHNIAYLGDKDMHMPPPNNKANIQPLTKEQIGLVRAWIDQGAK